VAMVVDMMVVIAVMDKVAMAPVVAGSKVLRAAKLAVDQRAAATAGGPAEVTAAAVVAMACIRLHPRGWPPPAPLA